MDDKVIVNDSREMVEFTKINCGKKAANETENNPINLLFGNTNCDIL